MKKILMCLVCTAGLLPIGVYADNFSLEKFSFGAKAGLYKVSQSDFDPALMLSGQVSYALKQDYQLKDFQPVNIAAEFELGATASDADVDVLPSISGAKTEYSATTIAAYLSARTQGSTYAIGRVGIAQNKIEITGSSSLSGSVKGDASETGLVFGGGVGFKLFKDVEIELTRYTLGSESAFYLSAGLAF